MIDSGLKKVFIKLQERKRVTDYEKDKDCKILLIMGCTHHMEAYI